MYCMYNVYIYIYIYSYNVYICTGADKGWFENKKSICPPLYPLFYIYNVHCTLHIYIHIAKLLQSTNTIFGEICNGNLEISISELRCINFHRRTYMYSCVMCITNFRQKIVDLQFFSFCLCKSIVAFCV